MTIRDEQLNNVYRVVVGRKPGIFQMISPHDLLIDMRYQRGTNENRSKRIAENFDMFMFGVICVAKRPDGTLAVPDGGHRVHAAKIAGIDKVPCFVWEISDPQVEAKLFLGINKGQSPPDSYVSFEASVFSGSEDHLLTKGIVEKYGYCIAKKSGKMEGDNTVGCPEVLLWACRNNREVFEKSFDLCVKIASGEYIKKEPFQGIFYLEMWLIKNMPEVSVFQKENSDKLIQAGMVIIERICREKSTGHSGYRNAKSACARAVADVLNKGRRKGKIDEQNIG